MKAFLRLLACGSLGLAVPAGAGIIGSPLDHLHCYGAKDPSSKTVYTANFGATQCQFTVPAKLVCRPARKTDVSPPPPNSVTGDNLPERFACYKAKCSTSPSQVGVQDQFGTRTVTLKTAKLVCAPSPVVWTE